MALGEEVNQCIGEGRRKRIAGRDQDHVPY